MLGTCYFDVHVVIEQEILRLEVTMHYLPAMTILHRREDLPEFAPGFRFAQTAVVGKIICAKKAGISQEDSVVSLKHVLLGKKKEF